MNAAGEPTDGALLPQLPDLSAAAAAYAQWAAPLQHALVRGFGGLADTQASTIRGAVTAASGQAPSQALSADRRFADPLWQSHGGFRALGEAYLAWTAQVHSAIDALPLQGREPERWHAAAGLLLDALAPTNALAGNPAALRRAFETGGASLASGLAQWLHDLAHNQGLPSAVDASGFEIGRNLAATPGAVVLRHEMFELIQYATPAGAAFRTPLLYVPPQINRYYMIDLAPGRSFIEHAVEQGLRPFVISWRNPGPEHRDWGLEAYVAAVLEAIDAVCAICGTRSLNLAGSCTGGITATCATAVLRSRGAPRVQSLTLMVATIDSSLPNAFNRDASPQAVEMTKQLVRARGVLDGREMAAVFAWMRPNEMVWNNWVNNVLLGNSPPAFDMLAWNQDTTRLPARFHADLLDLGASNMLMRPGLRTLLDEPLDLSRIDVPLYVIGGLTDHIAPWAGCYAAVHATRGESVFVLGNGGHIQSIIAPPGTRKAAYFTRPDNPPAAEEWLAGATRHDGSWWPHWSQWVAARSGARTRTPATPGDRRHPPLARAPGTYVFGQ